VIAWTGRAWGLDRSSAYGVLFTSWPLSSRITYAIS